MNISGPTLQAAVGTILNFHPTSAAIAISVAAHSTIAMLASTKVRARALAGAAGTSRPEASELPDDFADHARTVLGDDPERLSALLSLRSEIQTFLAPRVPGFTAPTAEMLNARNQHLLDQAALLLGPEKFEQLFGVAAGERIDLVDSNMAAAQRGQEPQIL